MPTTNRPKKKPSRVSYSYAEFAAMAGREVTWTYRQVQKGRVRAITGFGAAMIPASEVERIFGSLPVELSGGVTKS
jgi:hypothetical protein